MNKIDNREIFVQLICSFLSKCKEFCFDLNIYLSPSYFAYLSLKDNPKEQMNFLINFSPGLYI